MLKKLFALILAIALVIPATASAGDLKIDIQNGTIMTVDGTPLVLGTEGDDGIILKMDTNSIFRIKNNCVTEAVDSGAGTQAITDAIPAAAVVLGVSCRVGTVIAGAGAASWSLGDGVDADLYGTGLAFGAGTLVDADDYVASPLTQAWSASAADLTMTANAGQFDSGSVTCCVQYVKAGAM